MADSGPAGLSDRIQHIADALHAQSRVIGMMLTNQKLEIEMLAKVLEAVTSKPDAEGDPLRDLLAQLVHASGEHGQKLDLILQKMQPTR